MEDYGVFWVVTVPGAAGVPPTPGYLGVGQVNFISKNIDRGRFLLLGDRSLWEVTRIDRIEARFWFAYTNVVVVSSSFAISPFVYSIVELPAVGRGVTVGARYLKVPALFLSEKSDDGSVVRLSDGSVWSVDSFQTFGWFGSQTIYVVDDRDGLGGYRLVNSDDRTSAAAQLLR